MVTMLACVRIRPYTRYHSRLLLIAAAILIFYSVFHTIAHYTEKYTSRYLFSLPDLQPQRDRDDQANYGGHFSTHIDWTVPRYPHEFERFFLDSYTEYRSFLNRQSRTYPDAVKNYQKRYNRPPPQGFDKWFEFARSRGCLVIDDYDTIEESVAPYREMSKDDLLRRMKELREFDGFKRLAGVLIQNGNRKMVGDGLWQLLNWESFVRDLPDTDIYINGWDEPFVFPEEHNATERVSFFSAGKKPLWPELLKHCKVWEGKGVRRNNGKEYIATMQEAKEALNICAHPEYEGTHGFFNAPTSLTVTKQLVPIFSVARMSVFRDLVLPSSQPWHPNFLRNDGVKEFLGKTKKLYWRGSATGGNHDAGNALKSHRMRLASLSQEHPDLIDAKVTTYFGDLEGLKQQWREFGEPERADKLGENEFAFLMDMDGNGLSGRYYRLLRSKAVVFKSTGFQQWHDDRLFPWVHYVPVRLGMKEVVNMVRWFATTERGEEIGRRIAQEADWWSRNGMREFDGEAYTYRLLLEYATLFK